MNKSQVIGLLFEAFTHGKQDLSTREFKKWVEELNYEDSNSS
jgi:hypothetical protein